MLHIMKFKETLLSCNEIVSYNKSSKCVNIILSCSNQVPNGWQDILIVEGI